jgi:hypothetical protein
VTGYPSCWIGVICFCTMDKDFAAVYSVQHKFWLINKGV